MSYIYINSFKLSDWSTSYSHLTFYSDGTRAYVERAVYGGDYIYEVQLASPWNLTTASFTG